MKNFVLLLVLTLFISVSSFGQSRVIEPYMDITVGYAPDADYKAAKLNFSANNIVVNRFGVYMSLEKGVDSDYFSNILGITGSITNYLYLFVGADLYSDEGLVANNRFQRKEAGIGVTPFKWAAVRVGYSSSVGATISAGFKIPLSNN